MALVATADFDRWKTTARRFADGFTPGQKAVTAVALVGVVVGSLLFMSFVGKPTYTPLFTNLAPADAAGITAKLASDKVPYQLQGGGSTILVPQSQVDQERINMAQAGLPATSTNVGLGILDKEGITSSQMTQQADYLRALQGELQQTIGSIHGVTGVQVNLAIPANDTFALNNKGPTGASVLVDTGPGQTITGGQVQAIVHLVASSVPNLHAADVTVADSNGDLLAGPGVNTASGSNNTATSAYDLAQQAKIAAYLQGVLGPNNADIQVNAQLNFDQVSTTTNGFQMGPSNTPITVPTQTQTSTQTMAGGTAPPGGVLGSTTAPPPGAGNGNYKNSSITNSYQTGTVTTTSKQAPGTVKSQSVAVLVNSAHLPQGVSLATLKTGVAAAAGIIPGRGDTLAMSSVPFSTVGQAVAKQAAKAAAIAHSKAQTSQMIRLGGVAVAILVALFFLWRSAKRARKDRISLPSALSLPGYPIEASPITVPTTEVPAGPRSGPPEMPGDITHFIDSQPDDVATLLRTWMQDRVGAGVSRNGSSR